MDGANVGTAVRRVPPALRAALAALLVAAACEDRREAEQSAPALTRPDPETVERTPRFAERGPPERLGEGTVEGTVARATARELVVRPGGAAEPLALEIVPGIPVTVDGQVSSAARIPEGAQVRATFVTEDGVRRAARVVAHTR